MAAPARGDLAWITFSPDAGHEQSGRRPAIVISPREYHQKTTFAVVCPITSTVKGYPFEVPLPAECAISGAVLSDQIKSIDRHARKIEVIGRAPERIMDEITAKLKALLL